MKALLLEAGDLAMKIAEVPDPLLKAGMVLVRIKAAALNHRDLWITKGQYAGIKYPMILGSDGAGIVEEVGKDVDKELLGTNVILNPSNIWGENDLYQGPQFQILGLPNNGTFAQLISIPAEYVYEMPPHLTSVQAAALPLAGLTAYRALFFRARLNPADRVLVTGIGGGVALFALQFAVAAGCEVWVSSSSDAKIRAAIGLGAKGGGRYDQADWATKLREEAGHFDVIVDGAGGSGFASLIDLAGSGARIVLYGGTRGNIEAVSPQKIFWKQLSIMGTTMGSTSDFSNMLRLVNSNNLVPVVDEVFPFVEAQQAFQKMAAGGQMGKLVLQMPEQSQ